MRRDFTTVGKEYTDHRMDEINAIIENLEWTPVDELGPVGYIQGQAINHFIREMKVPKVFAIAISHEFAPLGFYGIQAQYKNEKVNIYLIDAGTVITPICMDVEPNNKD